MEMDFIDIYVKHSRNSCKKNWGLSVQESIMWVFFYISEESF